MTNQTLNVEELRHVDEWVQHNAALPVKEREWEQGDWISIPGSPWDTRNTPDCKTAYCVAGYVAVRHGWKFDDRTRLGPAIVTKDGVWSHPADVARGILGLNEDQATALFAMNRTAYEIHTYVENFIAKSLESGSNENEDLVK